MLLNLSNHPSITWPANQMIEAISCYQQIIDMPFPQIAPSINDDDLQQLVESYVLNVKKLDPLAVHIMGELTFTYRLVNRLKEIGYHCIASTTERIVIEDGTGNKTSTFNFVQFRDY